MTKQTISKAINEINAELIDNAITYKNEKHKNNALKYTAIAAAFIVIVVAGLICGKSFLPIDNGTNGGDFQNTAHKKVSVIGNGYTDEQIVQYVNEIKSTVAFAVSAEYADTNEIKIMTNGYCHASLGKKNVLNRDFLTLPVIAGDKIVATVVVFNIDGELTNTICIGGGNWDKINSAFKENPDKELVFAYAGGVCEVIITPENKIYEIIDGGKEFLDEGEDWYSLLKTPFNTFSSSDFDKFISVCDTPSPLDSIS